MAGVGSLSNLGIFFHFLQDSYSHYDYAGNPNIGQATGLFAVDHTNNDPVKAMRMARDTWFWLNQFAKKKNLCCRLEEPDWQIVYKFVMVGYDISTVGGQLDNNIHEISNEQLRRKIEILGVPWRSPNGRSRP